MNACVKAHEAFNYDKLSLYMTHKLASELFLLFLKEKKKTTSLQRTQDCKMTKER